MAVPYWRGACLMVRRAECIESNCFLQCTFLYNWNTPPVHFRNTSSTSCSLVDLLKMVSIQHWEEAEQKILVKAILKVRDQRFQLAKSGKRHPASFERCSVFIGLVFCQSSLWTFAGNQTYECQNMLFTLLKLATSFYHHRLCLIIYPWKMKSTTDTHNFLFPHFFPGPWTIFGIFGGFFCWGRGRPGGRVVAFHEEFAWWSYCYWTGPGDCDGLGFDRGATSVVRRSPVKRMLGGWVSRGLLLLLLLSKS